MLSYQTITSNHSIIKKKDFAESFTAVLQRPCKTKVYDRFYFQNASCLYVRF